MEYISPQEAARRWGVSISTVRRMLSEKALGNAAFKVRHRWRILSSAMPRTSNEGRHRPCWLTTSGEADSAWERHHAPQMSRFIRELVEELQPRFIIVRHRKGERVFAALRLIPREVLPRVFELDFFRLMPEAHRRKLLSNATILILDDTMQRGRYTRWMRSWLESQDPSIRVFTACLFLRRSSRTSGELEDPDARAYQELDDYQYRLATAELSRVYRSLWPLDVEHPTISIRVPESLSDEEILKRLGMLGHLIELPPLTADPNVRVIVVEDIQNPSFKSLALPRVAQYWPPKLRCLWLRDRRILVLAGIWFPIVKASVRWFKSYQPSQIEPWFPYLGLDNTVSWKELTPEQRAHRLFRAFAIYAGSRLVSTGFAAVTAGSLGELGSESAGWEPVVEGEDYIRVYGHEAARQIVANIRGDILREAERQRTFAEILFVQPVVDKPVGDLTVQEFVAPLVAVFQRLPEEEHKPPDGTSSRLLTRADLEAMVNQWVATVETSPEMSVPASLFSSQLDVGLDHAFIAPSNFLERIAIAIKVERAYEPCEVSHERSLAEIDSTFIAKRLIYAVPVVLGRFQKALGSPADIHRLVFHKLFVNLQANLVEGAVNPRGGTLERCVIFERGNLLGPMSHTVPALTPHDIIELDRFLQRRGIITVKPREDGIYINIAPSVQANECLKRFEDLWRELGESLLTDAELLGHIYKDVRAKPGYRGPTAGDMLTALAACSNDDRFIRYAVEDIRIWYEASTSVVAFLTSPEFRTAKTEDDLDRLLTASSALSNKLTWYSSISEWRSELEHLPVTREYAKLRLLRRIDAAPKWEKDGQPRARLILDVEPMVRLVGTLLRYLASQLGMAGRFVKYPKSQTACSMFDPSVAGHDWCNLLEISLALRCQSPVEIERASDALDKVGAFSGKEMTPEVADGLSEIWKTVNEILVPVLQMSPSFWSTAA